MGVCSTIVALANALTDSGQVVNPQHKLMVHLLGSMPLYLEVRRLDLWESAFLDAFQIKDDQSLTGLLVYAVFCLGAYNLYGAFDEPGTRTEFSDVARRFAEAGVPVPAAVELSDW